MSYKIARETNYLSITFCGSTSFEENARARQEVIAVLNSEGIKRVLVDMTQADLSLATLEDVIEFGESWEGQLVSDDVRFASLVPYGHPFRDKIDLSVWTGVMKGVQLKIFEDRELAVRWLKMDG